MRYSYLATNAILTPSADAPTALSRALKSTFLSPKNLDHLRTFQRIRVRLRSARINLSLWPQLKNEGGFRIVGELGSDVFHASSPLVSEKIEAEAVLTGVGFRHKACPEHDPLRGVHDALEDGVLHPLPVIFAKPGHAAQSASSRVVACAYVVADKDHHAPITSRKRVDRRPGHREYAEPTGAPAHKEPDRAEFAPSDMGVRSRPAFEAATQRRLVCE